MHATIPPMMGGVTALPNSAVPGPEGSSSRKIEKSEGNPIKREASRCVKNLGRWWGRAIFCNRFRSRLEVGGFSLAYRSDKYLSSNSVSQSNSVEIRLFHPRVYEE
jgi:hypothetical protein